MSNLQKIEELLEKDLEPEELQIIGSFYDWARFSSLSKSQEEELNKIYKKYEV